MRAGARTIMLVIYENILYQNYQTFMIYLIKCHKNECKKLRNKSNSIPFFSKSSMKNPSLKIEWFFGGGYSILYYNFFYVQYEQTSWCAWKAASERTFFVFIVYWYLFSKKIVNVWSCGKTLFFSFRGGGMSWVREIILVMSQAEWKCL